LEWGKDINLNAWVAGRGKSGKDGSRKGCFEGEEVQSERTSKHLTGKKNSENGGGGKGKD